MPPDGTADPVVELERGVGTPHDRPVVRRDHERDTGVREGDHRVHHVFRRDAVELGRRLVRDDDRRAAHQDLRDRRALLLAARELRRQVVGAFLDPERREQLVLFDPRAPVRQPAGEPKVLADGEVREEVV